MLVLQRGRVSGRAGWVQRAGVSGRDRPRRQPERETWHVLMTPIHQTLRELAVRHGEQAEGGDKAEKRRVSEKRRVFMFRP